MNDYTSWASSAGARRSMRSNRGRDTSLELNVRRELHRRGLRYFVNRRPVPDLRRTADIVFPRLKIAICLDGCFWHGCSEHHTVAKTNASFWAEKVRANRDRDLETTRLWEKEGWTVLRYWEHSLAETTATDIFEQVFLKRRGL